MKVQVLSLANIPNLKSSVLEALLPLTGGREESIDAVSQTPSVLRDLDLSNTAVDDGAVPYLASCKNLTRLNLEATKMSGGQEFPQLPEQISYGRVLQGKAYWVSLTAASFSKKWLWKSVDVWTEKTGGEYLTSVFIIGIHMANMALIS